MTHFTRKLWRWGLSAAGVAAATLAGSVAANPVAPVVNPPTGTALLASASQDPVAVDRDFRTGRAR